MPAVDQFTDEYADRVDFVAVAWKGTPEGTAEQAARLMPSGNWKWGLDTEEEIFSAYGVPYQPVTALISADRVIVAGWAGIRPEEEIRQALELLVAGQ